MGERSCKGHMIGSSYKIGRLSLLVKLNAGGDYGPKFADTLGVIPKELRILIGDAVSRHPCSDPEG